MDALPEQVNALKIDRVATSFKPSQVTYEQETGKVFVTGELTTQGPNAKAETKNRTYEFLLAIHNGRCQVRCRIFSFDFEVNPALFDGWICPG
jgi:hypothetical protein